MIWIVGVGVVLVIAIALYDLTQRQHAILRTFPIVGHFRYLLEAVGPELRQYIVTDNNEERPFSRDQRRWIYASAKRGNNYFGFGSDNEMELQPSYLIIKHDTFPLEAYPPGHPEFDPQHQIPCAKVMGGARGRARAFRPKSMVNVSGMSFGSLSGPAVEALNRGSEIAGCLQSTGEGGVSSHHLQGGDLVWQVGTGYFGCREPDGRFSMRAIFPNADEKLFPNQFVNINLKLSTVAGATVVPSAAIQRASFGTFVYVIKPDNKATIRKVTLGVSEGERVAITEGVTPGERIVLEGVDALQEGVAVQIVATRPQPAPPTETGRGQR